MSWNFLALRSRASGAQSLPTQGGFGLVELMVSISVMAIVSAVILVRQNTFNSALLLRSEAYEIALTLREIQLSAVSASSGGTGEFRSVLGVHFDTNSSGQYKIFKDTPAPSSNANGFYDSGEDFGTQGKLDPRFEIREIRAIDASTPFTGSRLSVVFVRPNFDARFFDSGGEVDASSIEIDVAIRGATDVRTVEVTSTGQIAVQ